MPTLPTRYIDETVTLLTALRAEAPRIEAAARLVAGAIAGGRRFFAFGCSHSSLAVQDAVYRAGGLMLVNPLLPPGLDGMATRPAPLTSRIEQLPGYAVAILDNSPLRAGDVLVVVSVSGRNAVPVEMAEEAAVRGATVVGITSAAYAGVGSRAPSGRLLVDVCHLVIDNRVPLGDAVLAHPGVPQPFGPVSTVLTTALVQALVAGVIEELAERGITPPVYLSANVDGGAEWNERLLAENADRIFYL